MDNKSVAGILKLTVKLMELHDENPFKIRSYQSAVNSIERGGVDIEGLDLAGLQKISGIGKSIAEAILAIQATGTHPLHEELLQITPDGLLEVLQIKGLGPKKVRTLWQELSITSTHELMEACQSGQVAKIKGFGERTQEGIIRAMEYTASNQGKWLYADVEKAVEDLQKELGALFGNEKVAITGEYARRIEILEDVEWVVATKDGKADFQLINRIPNLSQDLKTSSPFAWRGKMLDPELAIYIHFTSEDTFVLEKLLRTGSRAHLLTPVLDHSSLADFFKAGSFETEEQAYQEAGLAYIAPELREGHFEIEWAKEGKLPELLKMEDLKGSLHNHSTYSDGKHSLREMALYCRELGYEYLGIADHSQSAFYAGGMDLDKIEKQQDEIRSINKELAPFKVFAGVESDILIDGSLDYPEEILQSFDFIVSSIHSSLGMNRQKATARLLRAIENPYTTILGHPTGRLLLRREGYPIDHKMIIEACAANGVVIEINANPWRLDLDWRWVHYALERGVPLSINPDAHEKAAFMDMRYGVLTGRKGGLSKEMTFNARSVDELTAYFAERKAKIQKR